jgi:hypothetical protein
MIQKSFYDELYTKLNNKLIKILNTLIRKIEELKDMKYDLNTQKDTYKAIVAKTIKYTHMTFKESPSLPCT